MFALVDCNNFYASCEQLFNPKLIGKPVVVLSNNDGCVIARSKEARKLGVPMGAPAFKWQAHFDRHQVVTLSSNFTLYGDMSARVFDVIASFGCPVEIYSVDEAFMLVDQSIDPQAIRDKVYQWTGIPTSVGVGVTKTLAKVATHIAKERGDDSFILKDPSPYLKHLPAREIWGMGSRYAKKLASLRVHNAQEFVDKSDSWIKKHFTVSGLQTALELRGTPCFTLDDSPPSRKSIVSSRTFKAEIGDLSQLQSALSAMVTRACEKLRQENLMASQLTLFVATSPFREAPYRSESATFTLPHPTHDTFYMISRMKGLLDQIYSPDCLYKRGGVMLCDFATEGVPQMDMLAKDPNRETLMHALDHINAKYGPLTLHSAAMNRSAKQRLSSGKKLKYTTSWDDIIKIQI